MTPAQQSRWLFPLLAIAVAVPMACVAQLALGRAVQRRNGWPAEADALYLPSSSILARASLGHRQLFADLIAARTNVYFGGQLQEKGRQRWLHFYLDTVADLDPYFEPIYLRGAAMLVYNGAEMTLDMFEKTDRLLARGLHYFPNNWEIWFQKGFNQAFEMPKYVAQNSPRRRAWTQQGTEELRRSTLYEGIPAHLPNLVAGMLTKNGQRELAIQHLERTYAITSDPGARFQIKSELLKLLGAQYRDTFEMEGRRLEELVKSRYPYADEAFSIIAGPREPAAVDIAALRRIDLIQTDGPAGEHAP